MCHIQNTYTCQYVNNEETIWSTCCKWENTTNQYIRSQTVLNNFVQIEIIQSKWYIYGIILFWTINFYDYFIWTGQYYKQLVFQITLELPWEKLIPLSCSQRCDNIWQLIMRVCMFVLCLSVVRVTYVTSNHVDA